MTERRAIEPFERQFADRVRAYTDRATERRIDALEFAQTAMSSPRATGSVVGRLGTGLLGRRIAGVRLAAVVVIVVLVGVASIAILGRPPDYGIGPQPTPASSTPSPTATAGGPIPDALRHSWERPMAVEPGLDKWGSGFLVLGSGLMDFGPEPGAGASQSRITAAGVDVLLVTATGETHGCAIGDLGTYRWSMRGSDTVLTLTAISSDACATRETALAGDWVRSFPPRANGEITLAPGTYVTSSFDPFGNPAAPIRLSYTVPGGWKVQDDSTATFVLNHPSGTPTGQPSPLTFVALLAQPRMAADFTAGQACGPGDDAPGVGGSVDDLAAAIVARPGVVSTPPAAVTIGGHQGKMLDLSLAKSWTGSCHAPEGPVVGLSILNGGGRPGPVVGLSPDHPVRLILLDLGNERTMAVVIFDLEPSQPVQFQKQVAEVMPIIESFEFHPPTP